ncbi:hypothetical protein GWN26_11885 [Candidatus Saccharibacteria bacterium]|nr:hypothetical protein [Candidatus Saccharibacteria bacterium]NIV04199.1 hypothetical protein [Calditrichia bacterium]NIS37853.1 hypothetical protein [Candidatus Saccharibacteria bacterium]NIV72151.1 hypothetical protein [Calditrichia bacterium]NIV99780.1 hypothetical protein [Candidatus Saccharibacteria bacterium]
MKKEKSPLVLLRERENYVLARLGYTVEEMGIDSSLLKTLTDFQFEEFIQTLEDIEDGKPIRFFKVW